MAGKDYPLRAPRSKPIGTPYQGTHAKTFNVQGGSDNWESENAVDIAAPDGTPVVAVADGTIGPQIGSLGTGGRFAGLRVHLVTGNNEFYYAHLSRLAVKAGDTVTAGQVIGYSGSANNVSHLHFAAKSGDPRAIFGDSSPSAPSGDTTTTATSAGSSSAGSSAPTTAELAAAEAPPPSLPQPTVQDQQPIELSLKPHEVASTWQQLSVTFPSPDTQRFAQLASLAAGG